MNNKKSATDQGKSVTKKDLRTLYLRSFFLQSSFSFERMQGVGLTWMFIPLIKKLYDSVEERAAALKRHLVFYNTNPLTAAIITGMVAAMEEAHAKGEMEDPSAINSLKGSLIGPLAGIGASFFLIVIAALLGIAVDSSMQGSPVGVIILTLGVSLIWYGGLWVLLKQGYHRGEALLEQLTGAESSAVMSAIGIVGAMVVGGLVGTWINIITPFADGLLQDQLDQLLPKVLPLGFTLLAFRLIQKGWSAVWVMLLMLVIGMALGHIGLLGTPAG